MTTPQPDTAAVRASQLHCAAVTRRAARNFYYGLRLTPEPRRAALYALYAWSRLGDDIVDEPERGTADERREQLRTFEVRTESAIHGIAPGDRTDTEPSVWPALADACRTYPIDRGLFRDMLAGLRSDLDAEPVRTREELMLYCDRVASSVGRMCVAVWGLTDPSHADDADRLAIARGRAFQLTNILRDTFTDLSEQPPRVYLPAESFHAAGISPTTLRTWNEPLRCRRFIAEWAEEARQLFEASRGLEQLITPSCRPTLTAMTGIYRRILGRIIDEPRLVAGPRPVSLPAWTKARIAIGTLLVRPPAVVSPRRGGGGAP